MKKVFGFTLLELLIVTTIIGILSTLSFVVFNDMKEKTRNTIRVSSISQIRDALESYYRDQGTYPITADVIPGQPIASSSLVYMQRVPHNPEPRDDGDCPDQDFFYEQRDNGISYTLTFCLGKKTSNLPAGTNVAIPIGIIH